MDRQKELKQIYKETPIQSGVYKITNTTNNKVYIGSTNNLKRLNGVQFMLKMNSHTNKTLQADWNKFGAASFEIEILEMLKKKEEGYFDAKRELAKLEEKWIAKLEPFGENGYIEK
ncbi:GIY-YIG nuclease family protein [Viridibacillus sp. YIM B01967]|uniref:GIY-YIG nuclease family protein n=1 Tax=Viridibacillus soli TaxID=2798301 RepID=A0ABS1H5W1_9BACL|nr:GIY-YIG nuclease family protein [Viridibacillus soli]MBK3494676.1 GIY-YIG nuclease family protein [Viridibacillus soli]